VVLVHIPLELYPYFLKSVLGLIFDETSPLEDNEITDDAACEDSAYKTPAFMNVSITPVEVSVMCPRRLVEKYFVPVMNELDQVDPSLRSRLIVSEKDYIAMQVLGEGLEAGKRVLELTSPLALAGMYVHNSKHILYRAIHQLTALKFHLFHFHLLLRLHHSPQAKQNKRNERPRKQRLPIRHRNLNFHHKPT
jgi:hypothetical protein